MTINRDLFLLIILIGLTLIPKSAIADVDKTLQSRGWHEVIFNNKQRNQFRALSNGGIEVVSDGSVSLLQMPLTVDISEQPILHWRWCVAKPAPLADLSVKGNDDRSLAIFVAFPFVEEGATAFERMERRVVEATHGKNAPGRVLVYVWGGQEDRGALVRSPHLGDSGMMKIVRPGSAPPGQWFTEDIDIAKDYREAFGNEAPDPIHIAISADTDDTKSSSRGIVTGLKFVASPKVF